MTLAAADAAENRKAAPPSELTLQWQCERYSVLPEAGGLNDQPAGLVARMEHAAGVYRAMQMYRNLSADKFRTEHPTYYDLWAYVRKVRARQKVSTDG